MNEIILTAPAKVNLSLHITGRRDDGYHLLNSIMAFTDFGDRMILTPAQDYRLSLTGPFADGLGIKNNLINKAVSLWQDLSGDPVPYHITLEKNLPVAAGLGGGSSDAATLLNYLNKDQSLPLLPAALSLGAEMPVCLYGHAARVQGIGENVQDFSMPEIPVMLVNPGQACPTLSVFDLYRKQAKPFSNEPFQPHHNDLLDAATTLIPDIRDILNHMFCLSGCNVSGMSGSGATCYALFDNETSRDKAAAAWRDLRPNDWVQTGRLNPGAQSE